MTRESWSSECHAQYERARERAETERPGDVDVEASENDPRWDAKCPVCGHRGDDHGVGLDCPRLDEIVRRYDESERVGTE
jgi:hypothetical protein